MERDGLRRQVEELNVVLNSTKDGIIEAKVRFRFKLLRAYINTAFQMTHHKLETVVQEKNKDIEMLKSRIAVQSTNFSTTETLFKAVNEEMANINKCIEFERECGIVQQLI